MLKKRSAINFDAEIRPPCFSKGNQQEHHDARLCGLRLCELSTMHDTNLIQIDTFWYILIIWYLIWRPSACMTCITKRPKPLPKPQHEKSTCLRKEKSQKHSLTLAQVKQWPPFNRDYDWLSVHECVCVLTVHPSSQGKTSSRICPHLTVSSNSLNIGLTSHC